MRLRNLAIVALGLAAAASASNGMHVSLHFADSASVNDTVIRLRDIAYADSMCYGIDVKPILDLIVGESAPAGYCRRVGTDDVVDYLLRQKFPAVRFSKVPRKSVCVSTAAVEKNVGDYESVIREFLRDSIRWGQGDYFVELRNSAEKFKCLNKPFAVFVSGLTSKYPKGLVNLLLTAKQGTKSVSVPVVCNVKVVTNVLVSTKQIDRGTALDSSNCNMQKMDITRFGHESVPSCSELRDMVAMRTVSKGTIIYSKMVVRRPIVSKDEEVYVVVARGRIKVSIAVRARENGALGDKIWVENESTHMLLKTTVIGKDRVTLLDGGKEI